MLSRISRVEKENAEALFVLVKRTASALLHGSASALRHGSALALLASAPTPHESASAHPQRVDESTRKMVQKVP